MSAVVTTDAICAEYAITDGEHAALEIAINLQSVRGSRSGSQFRHDSTGKVLPAIIVDDRDQLIAWLSVYRSVS